MKRDAFEENKLVYLPAILPSKGLYEKDGVNYNFWNKEKSSWLYKNLLISTYHAIEVKDLRKELSIDKDVFILGDSGGFQMVTLGGYISPKDVIKWQMANCDAGLILDIPPYKFGGGAQFSGTPEKKFFMECLTKTKENALIALKENKGKNKIRLYGVIQGENYNQMNTWYNEIKDIQTENEKFDAWALSPKPSTDATKIALLGILIMENKIKLPLHILQVSGKGGTAISSYIRHLTQTSITIDSSSFSMSARFGLVIDPMYVPNTIIIGDKLNKENLNGWFCDCPICNKFDISFKNVDKLNPNVLNLHNLYQYGKYVKYCDGVAQIEDEIEGLCRKISSNTYEAFKLLQYYKNNGIDKTRLKYMDYFEGGFGKDNKPKSLMGF